MYLDAGLVVVSRHRYPTYLSISLLVLIQCFDDRWLLIFFCLFSYKNSHFFLFSATKHNKRKLASFLTLLSIDLTLFFCSFACTLTLTLSLSLLSNNKSRFFFLSLSSNHSLSMCDALYNAICTLNKSTPSFYT